MPYCRAEEKLLLPAAKHKNKLPQHIKFFDRKKATCSWINIILILMVQHIG